MGPEAMGTGLALAFRMDDHGLRLRIRVITISTRAAVHSLGRDDPQLRGVVERGRSLLEDLAPIVESRGSDGARQALERARDDLSSLTRGDPERPG